MTESIRSMFEVVERRKIIIVAAALMILLVVTAVAQITDFASPWDLDRSFLKTQQVQVDSLTKNADGKQSETILSSIDGKEKQDNEKFSVTMDNGKLVLTSIRKVKLPSGEMTTATVKEKLEFAAGDEPLKTVQQLDSPDGKVTIEIYFTKTKKSSDAHKDNQRKSSGKLILPERQFRHVPIYERDYKIYAQ